MSPSTIIAWWPMPDCCFRSPWPTILELGKLMDHHVDLADAPGRANTGDKMLTLVASALAGGDCIDDADALRTLARTAHRCWAARSRPRPPWAPSSAQLPVGPCSPVGPGQPGIAGSSVGLLAAGPGDDPLTIDLDSTVCETYGLAKEGRAAATTTLASGAIIRIVSRGRRHRRGADVSAAQGTSQHGSGRALTSCGRR